MRIILSGYARTPTIIPAVKYLLTKYLPSGFDVSFALNMGSVQLWSAFMRSYLEQVPDKYIIMADGDMLINKPMDVNMYTKLLGKMGDEVICARLCQSAFYTDDQYTLDDGIMTLSPTAPYTAVLQYCIWDREFLISILAKTSDPWNFEAVGSQEINRSGKKVIGTKDGVLSYFENGAFAHEGTTDLRFDGLSQEDRKHIEGIIDL